MNEYKNPYHFIRDNYYGNGGYSYCNSYSYLIKHPREGDDFYQDRRYNSNLENIFRPLQDLFLFPIWSATIQVGTQNEKLKDIVKETKILYRANQSLLDFKIYGNCSFSVAADLLKNGKIDETIYPTIKSVFPGDYIEVSLSGTKIVSAKYYEYENIDNIKVPIFVEYENNYFLKITKAWKTKEGKVTLEDQGEQNRITDFDGLQYGYLNKVGLDLDDIPSSFDLAKMQKQLFNLDTQRLDILRKNGWPIIVVSTDDDVDEICLSQDVMLKVPSTVSNMPEFLEADLQGVELTNEIINEKKSTIYKVVTNGLFSDNIKYTNAMALKIATRSFSAHVNTLYSVYQDILDTMVQNIIDIYDLNTIFEIDYPALNVDDEEMADSVQGELT